MMSNSIDILVVDDQPGLRMLLGEVFVEQGYVVDVAGDGYEALDKIADRKPTLVLMDVKMPLLNGLETINLLQKNTYQPMVVLMTANGENDVLKQANRMNVQHFINKPFDVKEVILLVRNLMAQATSHKQWQEIS